MPTLRFAASRISFLFAMAATSGHGGGDSSLLLRQIFGSDSDEDEAVDAPATLVSAAAPTVRVESHPAIQGLVGWCKL